MLYFFTLLHLLAGVAFIGYSLTQKNKTPLYLHVGLGALGLGAGMLFMLLALLYLSPS
ncbi:MAG: hypothetical protein KGZ92_01330 [Firmicutes bacterium]|nr:hypothetical protein [Dethiobacter sp.]MBS3887928.1 hypothetical protein [Bacillota bacterium]MBS4054232.1 hypothetical protein [Thermaerobacter sp.]